MSPGLRKLTLLLHVLSSVGWLGSVVAYLALAVSTITTREMETVRAAYLSMDLVGWTVIVPLSLASLATGLVQALGTEWGLFRHYWIVTKLVLTSLSVFILLRHMSGVSRVAHFAAFATSPDDFGQRRFELVLHPALGLAVLLTNTVLSFYKPWGMTPYGRRKQEERRASRAGSTPLAVPPT